MYVTPFVPRGHKTHLTILTISPVAFDETILSLNCKLHKSWTAHAVLFILQENSKNFTMIPSNLKICLKVKTCRYNNITICVALNLKSKHDKKTVDIIKVMELKYFFI